ncbi:hypothetical protein BCV69DRAFT_279575 [Microstroma glucosiphilum]|uniref:G-patch domain-containing protein n=1 Tax=Pseudomicrostroma glucosiphilum TaxID=1684307 RepID=A0A316UI86_9BASI|nr:hypothetical protein BCV69DRAFT_279575 [Pseudomicrostroma glucosiphilum]PWN23643.1 hypothetical protein BCV69DRAFT_279575 [Pseudomicrostroma glucosiphilum]
MSSSASRLRSRLARDELDTAQTSSVTENFVLIGTPLPALDKRDPNEGKPVWEQEVRDEQGRRRFHGAFTGGWSAGYYNTVGSKEGWTPSTFVSSRSGKPEDKIRSRPEDFMDEEDLADTEADRKISQRDGYSSQAKLDNRHANDDVLGDLLGLGKAARQQLEAGGEGISSSGLIAPKSSLGHRILARMGWKVGSGLGKPLKVGVPIADTPMPAIIEGASKKDTHGLGWTLQTSSGGAPSLADALQAARSDAQASSRGFDISALEEADEDDVRDIYGSSESIQDVIRRRKDQQMMKAPSREPFADKAMASSSVKLNGATRSTWRDGRALPEGFVIEDGSVIDGRTEQTQSDWFAPPVVPPGWTPDPLKVWSQAKGTAGPPPPASASATSLSKPTILPHQIKAADRGQLLGEARMPGPPPSLSSYLPGGPPPATVEAAPTSIKVPRLDATTARNALKGFLPFGNDAQKQKRYVAYLELQADPASSRDGTMPVPAGTIASQLSQEVEEFARSASIFKPLSSAMASRFASASTVEGGGDAHVPVGGLYQPEIKSKVTIEEEAKRQAKQEEERLQKEKEENMNDRQRAAKAGMFGHLTRQVTAWYPPRLLCKRFGVPDPHPERSRDAVQYDGDDRAYGRPADGGGDPFSGAAGGVKEERYARSEARRELKRGEERWERSRRELLGLVGERHWEGQGGQPISDFSSGGPDGSEKEDANGSSSTGAESRAKPLDLEQVGLGEDEEALKEIDSFVKPSREVFKSVFAPDEQDEVDQIPLLQPSAAEEQRHSVTLPLPTMETELDSRTKQGPSAPGEVGSYTTPSTAPSKPTFIPRNKRSTTGDGAKPGDAGPKKRKKDTKKMSGALTFSFDDEEEDAAGSGGSSKEVMKATKRKGDASKKEGDGEKGGEAESAKKAAPSRMRAADLF